MSKRLPSALCLLALLCAGATGCRHKVVVATVPIPPLQPVPVDTTAKAAGQPLIQPVAIRPVPLTPVDAPVKKKKKVKRAPVLAAAPAPTPTPAPAQVAAATPLPEANVIGALSQGGSDVPQQQHDAQDLINALEKRLAGLPQSFKDQARTSLLQVRSFHREAQIALNAGDVEGAITLATKAKLLLDDLMK